MATVSDHRTLDCPLCFKKFITPRVLPCCHTFCEKCLGDNIESQVQVGSSFMCPLCATPTVPSDASLPFDKWAGAFPLNTLINSILESTEISNKSETDKHCDSCKSDGETNNAEVWCIECQEKICSLCRKLHNRNKLLKHHTTVPVDEKDQYLHCNINFHQECGRHRAKVIELFCIDHRELCCSVCVAIDHRKCNDIRSIDDVARDQSQRRSSPDYSSIIRDFRKLKTEMGKIVTEKKINAKQVQQEKDKILQGMDNKIDRIVNYLNKLRNTFRNETEQMYKDTESSISESEKYFQSFTTNVKNSSEILEITEKFGTLEQKFQTFENLRHQISSHYLHIKPRLTDGVVMNITMNTNKVLTDIEVTLESVGDVVLFTEVSKTSRDVSQCVNEIIKNLNSSAKISTEMRAAQVKKCDLLGSPVTFVKVVNRDKLGSGTFLTGSAYLGNERLVMSDYSNRRLVELDEKYNFVKEYKIDCKPTDVATGNKDNEIYIAVRDVSKRFIYKCTLDTDLTIVNRIKAPPDTWGIAVSGDNIIVGTRDAVVILTQDGSTLRVIPKSGPESYIALSQTQRTIYHRDNDDIVCRTLEDQEVFRYQHQQLEAPRGMYIDRRGNLYICGKDSYNVHHVSSSDGHRSRIIRLHNISKPWNVILHPQKNQLVVTSYNEDTACEVYRLG